MRNYMTLEGAELNRLASLSSPSGRYAREELARRARVAANLRPSPQVEARRRAEAEALQARYEANLEAPAEPKTPAEVIQAVQASNAATREALQPPTAESLAQAYEEMADDLAAAPPDFDSYETLDHHDGAVTFIDTDRE